MKANNSKLIGTVMSKSNFFILLCSSFNIYTQLISIWRTNVYQLKRKLSSNLYKNVVNEKNKHKNINFVILFASILIWRKNTTRNILCTLRVYGAARECGEEKSREQKVKRKEAYYAYSSE